MKFTAVQQLLRNKQSEMVALESLDEIGTVNIDGVSLRIGLCTDKMIEENGLKEVTNGGWFRKGNIPLDDGLFSPIIFGDTPKEKMRNHGYINLKRKFFHPYIYEVVRALSNKIDLVASGQGVWNISEDGELEEIKDQSDVRYNEDNTGLSWLIENFRKISFKETPSDIRKERLKLINNLRDDQIFITKWVVIPLFWRDYDKSTGKASVPEINYKYTKLINHANSIDNEILSMAKHLTMYKIQTALVDIRKDGQALIEKKKGAFQKTILGKSPDFGGRGVISVPSLNGCDVPDDCLVDVLHSGIPLSYCISTGYPFIIKWLTEFFEDTFRNRQTIPAYRKGKDGKYQVEYVEIEDQTEYYTKDYIDKKLEMFKKTFGAERFETIKIRCKDGSEAEMLFTGKGYALKPDAAGANTISNRPLTWTDLVYLAAVETLSDKHCYITRYPLTDYFGTFPTKVSVLSTIHTAPMIINGKVYPHYPVIDLSLPPSEVATQFIDTISISNLYLDAIGGDYDGDTVSLKILFSLEANQEAAEMLENIKHYVSIQGKLVRVLGNETYLTFYNMTRRE